MFEGLCGKRNFKRRRRYVPYAFFCHVVLGFVERFACFVAYNASVGKSGLFVL